MCIIIVKLNDICVYASKQASKQQWQFWNNTTIATISPNKLFHIHLVRFAVFVFSAPLQLISSYTYALSVFGFVFNATFLPKTASSTTATKKPIFLYLARRCACFGRLYSVDVVVVFIVCFIFRFGFCDRFYFSIMSSIVCPSNIVFCCCFSLSLSSFSASFAFPFNSTEYY